MLETVEALLCSPEASNSAVIVLRSTQRDIPRNYVRLDVTAALSLSDYGISLEFTQLVAPLIFFSVQNLPTVAIILETTKVFKGATVLPVKSSINYQ